jgi:hypothetical protein
MGATPSVRSTAGAAEAAPVARTTSKASPTATASDRRRTAVRDQSLVMSGLLTRNSHGPRPGRSPVLVPRETVAGRHF